MLTLDKFDSVDLPKTFKKICRPTSTPASTTRRKKVLDCRFNVGLSKANNCEYEDVFPILRRKNWVFCFVRKLEGWERKESSFLTTFPSTELGKVFTFELLLGT